eukprot:12881563-Prorocentrum_lima.AAC.1
MESFKKDARRMQHRATRLCKMLTKRHDLASYEDAAKRLRLTEVIDRIQNNPQITQASDWVSARGGTKA